MHSVPVNTIMKVTTYRQLSLAVKVASEGPIRSITLFGSFRLVFDSRKHRYSVQRLVQVSLIKSQWVSVSRSLRKQFLARARFYFIRSHTSAYKDYGSLLGWAYKNAIDLLFSDLLHADITISAPPAPAGDKDFPPEMRGSAKDYVNDRCWGGRFSGGWGFADKRIGQFLRETISKETMRLFRKVFPQVPFSDITLVHYLDFSRKYRITGDCGALYSLIPHLADNRNCDGTNDWFASRLAPYLSRGDVKLLRVAPPSLVATAYLDTCRLLASLLRHPDVRSFPVPVLREVFSLLSQAQRGETAEISKFISIAGKWLIHHRTVWRTQGYIKFRLRWDEYISQLRHALDWVSAEEPLLHKNQHWSSIWRQVADWQPRLKLLEGDLRWKPLIPETVKTDGINFTELFTSEQLYEEGYEMHHCVYSYSERCYRRQYRVFRVESKQERATAGVIARDGRYSLDQIYTYCNGAVSKSLKQKTHTFLNQHINGHTEKKPCNTP
ncbi:PcfJ domain-containing protein [Serratia marcescens]|uniref:PcfJ domain-containing protein n=1 Tax=Serratia marcescens TaxID=615 RepID=UPI0024A60D07|nr:PcfJ domain-containing protein [Serratia marcescens]